MSGLIKLVGIVAALYKDDDTSEEYRKKGLLGGLYEYLDRIFISEHGFIKKEPKPLSGITKFYYASLRNDFIMCLSTEGNWRFQEHGNSHLLLWFDKMEDTRYSAIRNDLEIKLPSHHLPLEIEVTNNQKAEQLKSYFLDPTKFPLITKGGPP